MSLKRRAQDVFADSIDAEGVQDKKITEAMTKDDAAKAQIKDALAKNFVFAQLSGDELDNFMVYMEKVTVKSGEKIITQGEQGDFFYIVQTGSFDFVVDNKKVGSATEGGSFGELALLYGSPRAATVEATSNAVLWMLDRPTFRSTLASSSNKQKTGIVSALCRVELLAGLEASQLEAVADAVQVVKYPKGKQIIEKGSQGDIFYMIQEGTVKCTEVGAGLGDVTLGASDYFGEKALLTPDARAANVTAVSAVTLLALDRESFQGVLGPLSQLLDENLNMRVVRGISILQKLTEEQLKKAVQLFKLREFKAGEAIIKQGADGNEFFIIKAGTAKIEVTDSGTTSVVKKISSGDYFGEMALLSNDVRTATVTAEAPCECFALSRDDFTRAFGNLKDIMASAAQARQDEITKVVQEMLREDISFADLEVVAVLGAGTFGRVKLVAHKKTKETFALKAMHKSEVVKHRQQQNVMNEKNIMAQSKHPFILRLFNTFKDAHRLYLLLEFVQGGELFTVVHTPTTDGVPVKHCLFYSACVIMGLGYLHNKSIAYRDLKPENIMVDKIGYPKVVDFGFAKIVKAKTYTLCGTPEYLAPEIVLGRGHNKSVDWWAVGVLIYEMIAGYSPFADPHGQDQVVICQNIVGGRLTFPNKFDVAAKDVIKKLLVRDPVLRLGSGRHGEQDIREQGFFSKTNWDNLYAKSDKAPWIPPLKGDRDTSLFDPYEVDDTIDKSYVDSGNWDADF